MQGGAGNEIVAPRDDAGTTCGRRREGAERPQRRLSCDLLRLAAAKPENVSWNHDQGGSPLITTATDRNQAHKKLQENRAVRNGCSRQDAKPQRQGAEHSHHSWALF